MEQRFYQDMNADEQGRWVNEFATIIEDHGERIAQLGKGREQIQSDELPWVRSLFGLLSAWPFAADFCEKAMRYGDFADRAGRLAVYVDKAKEALADGLIMTDANGKKVAFVSPSTPLRRRGRPTKEEVAARLRGEALVINDNSPENEKRRRIAKMLGLEVVVSGDAPREKNNAELAAERAAKKAEEEKRNPSLFGGDGGVKSVAVPQQPAEQTAASPCAQLMSDSYEMRMAQDKLHLNQLAWLMSPELAKRSETVQSLRVTAESASERAKLLAEQGANEKDIETYAQQAKEATEAYLSIYASVDEELAVLHKRLYLDLPFIEKFKTKFKGVDVEKVLYITRPYYEKVKDNEKKNAEEMAKKGLPTIDERIRAIIERENPEYAARMKAEEERKQEIADLLRYIKRKDKPNVKQRIETMEKRYARLVELLGEEEARTYRPIVDAAIEDYEQNHKKPEKATVPADPAGGSKKTRKQQTKKSAKK